MKKTKIFIVWLFFVVYFLAGNMSIFIIANMCGVSKASSVVGFLLSLIPLSFLFYDMRVSIGGVEDVKEGLPIVNLEIPMPPVKPVKED